MKGTFFLGNKEFETREIKMRNPGPGEVLIRNRAAGICGTDVHIYHGEPGSAQVNPPVVLGHEFAGEITAVGEGVRSFHPGDHVAVDPNIYCGRCMPCRMGRKQNCENLYAFGVNANGGFQEYSVIPETQCYLLDPGLSYDEGAMMEPLACAVHGIDRAEIQPGQTVLIIGGGAIGMLMIQLARLSGASSVLLSEPNGKRRQLGLRVGADGVIDPVREDLCGKIRELSGRDGADVVIECVGNPAAEQQAVEAAGFGGTVVLFGVPGPDAVLSVPLFKLYKSELKILGSIINPDTNQRAVNLLNSGRLHVKELITHVYDLEHVKDAILMQMGEESVKVMVHP